ncbi:MAG: molybdenum cofactor biosynthesis protein MoaE [Ignavibacteriae bacterium]|nr:molybdenum cofactor biosynthesis protein MoaE [Ignavibacteria bacterium]MBI3363465.1 molybdenum cofactor biosynthesis protein MoaE [Ignavibacteriota bacterium]
MIEIVESKIDLAKVIESVQDTSVGGVDVFIGTTRNHSRGKAVIALEYEAYMPMALKFMLRIADEARARWDITKISIVHRLGRVDVGEASIVIAVSASHRHAAFEACRYAIDTLKRSVPIWKKEFFEDGELWVGLEGQEQILT